MPLAFFKVMISCNKSADNVPFVIIRHDQTQLIPDFKKRYVPALNCRVTPSHLQAAASILPGKDP